MQKTAPSKAAHDAAQCKTKSDVARGNEELDSMATVKRHGPMLGGLLAKKSRGPRVV